MFKKGLDELRELGSFSGSNIAQPNHPSFYGNPEPAKGVTSPEPEAAPDRGPEIERER
ncbi:hypothetical protein FTUN_2950 [Frigoriglobus tundricola]|uniref:Uncharacterized protein n=2 Tax=Frigoriglobus tundricola TaxID=2774151 RepID=A0A6M5YQ71_9BACT|nr:hypothetical protein FTUN_2950 [Frigoriglobus tundricola]